MTADRPARPTRVMLLVAPSEQVMFTRMNLPPFGVGVVAANLRAAGMEVEPYDLNADLARMWQGGEFAKADLRPFYEERTVLGYVRGEPNEFLDSFAGRLLRGEDIAAADVVARYAEDWDDAAAGFQYALALIAVLQASGADSDKQSGHLEVVETLGGVLAADADHWLARYCRARLRASVPTTYGVYQNFIDGERAKAATDVDELIERQAEASWQPHFGCSYLLAARLACEGRARDMARVGRLISAAAAQPGTPVPFPALGTMMCESFVFVYNDPDVPERAALGQLMVELFPGHQAVLSALRAHQPGGAP